MKALRIGLVVAALMVASLLCPMLAHDTDAAPDTDVRLVNYSPDIVINAGGTATIDISLWNSRSSGDINAVIVYDITYTGLPGMVSATNPDLPIRVDGGAVETLAVTLTADKYAPADGGTVTITVKIGTSEGEGVMNVTARVTVESYLSAGDEYNRVMGIWDSPWNEPAYTTLLSFMIWLLISFLVAYVAVPQLIFLLVKEEKEQRRDMRRQIWRPLSLLIMLFAFSSCARIYGVGEHITGMIDSVVGIAYIMVGALIVWRLYKAVVRFTFRKMSEKAGGIGIDESLVPLFNMIGKILIAVVAFASILAALGFDLLMILTGAGILGLAISLGAQSTLSQFFSGLTLLITRPFKAGDQVTVGDGEVLKVVRVGLMNTTFEDSGNSGTYTMPNNTVATSVINNITGKSNAYRMKFYVGIGYDADVDLAKRLLLEAAYENERIITDGSYDRPSVRLESFDASSVNMRVSVYVEDFDDRGSIVGEIREALFKKFKENDVSIPFPQIDVHME